MFGHRRLRLLFCFAAGFILAAGWWTMSFAQSATFSRPEALLTGTATSGSYGANWVSTWPRRSATARTQKLETAITGLGNIGQHLENAQGRQYGWPFFSYSADTSRLLLREAYLKFGGIVNGDTLVSECLHSPSGMEFLAPQEPHKSRNVLPYAAGPGHGFRAVMVDTFTYESGLVWGYDPYHGHHIPLGLEVILKASTWNYRDFANILLVDLTFTNIGNQTIKELYVGLEAEVEVSSRYNYGADSYDDLCGSLRDIGTVYVIDNDGNPDPRVGEFALDYSMTDGGGIRIARTSFTPADTNFNWWTVDYYGPEGVAFAPRRKPAMADPFRYFHDSLSIYPESDRDVYYLLSHDEWDYDQVLTMTISPDDPEWIFPGDSIGREASLGQEPFVLQSLGPHNLLPDSSARIIFSIFGAEMIHSDPYNIRSLGVGDAESYLAGLRFGIFRDRANMAVEMAELFTDPHYPPSGLRITYLSNDTIRLAWDPYVFDGIKGYELRFGPVQPQQFVTYGQVRPDAALLTPTRTLHLPPHQTALELTDIPVGPFQLVDIAHVTESGPGLRSPAVPIGYGNPAMKPSPPEPHAAYTFLYPDAPDAVLQWGPCDDTLIDYYKIYRTEDSLTAAERHRAFFAIDTNNVFIPKTAHLARQGGSDQAQWYYYETPAFDSVPAAQHAYIDRSPVSDTWYWITSVNRFGIESEPSETIRSQGSVRPTRDILVILGTTDNPQDYVREDSLTAFYHDVLDGLQYDLYHWDDSSRNIHADPVEYGVNWFDLARYRLVIVEELPLTAILKNTAEGQYYTLERIVASGRDLMYFGTPAGTNDVNLNSEETVLAYTDDEFIGGTLHLDSTVWRPWKSYGVYEVPDSLAGFAAANPVIDSLPRLAVDSPKPQLKGFFDQLFHVEGTLPATGAFYPDSSAEVIYNYESAFPESSQLHGLPCGVRVRRPGANLYGFSFHLWAMDRAGARQLIDYALQNQAPDSALAPQILPAKYRLYQNFPNPFNPTTTIRFDLGHASQVTLDVFNVLGRRVTTLYDGFRPAGFYALEWDGRSHRGQRVASGVYFYRLTTEFGTESRKMLLLR